MWESKCKRCCAEDLFGDDMCLANIEICSCLSFKDVDCDNCTHSKEDEE